MTKKKASMSQVLTDINPYITKNAYFHYQIRIFVPHFVCVFLYAGTINRTPTAADGLQ